MKRLASVVLAPSFTASLVLLLAACASEPPAQPAPPVMAPEHKAEAADSAKAWMGLWTVGEGLNGVTSMMGQKLHLDETNATDMAGRTCPQPSYSTDRQSEAVFLGLTKAEAESLKQPRPHLTVVCSQEAFGSYLMARDGSLLAVQDGQALHLVRAAMPEAKAPEEKKPDEKKAEAAPEKAEKAEKPGHLVYLASYRDKATAMAGWAELGKVSPLLSKASPELVKVSLTGKGSFLRLEAKGLSETDGAKLCKSLIKMLPDCGAKGRD